MNFTDTHYYFPPLQNLARQRASKFGQPQTNGIKQPSLSANGVHPHIFESPSSSILVTTTSPHVEFDTNDWHEDSTDLLAPRGYFADQFEVGKSIIHSRLALTYIYIYQNKSNFDAHFGGTGPEIWRQTNGHLNAFVSGAGALKYQATCDKCKHDEL